MISLPWIAMLACQEDFQYQWQHTGYFNFGSDNYQTIKSVVIEPEGSTQLTTKSSTGRGPARLKSISLRFHVTTKVHYKLKSFCGWKLMSEFLTTILFRFPDRLFTAASSPNHFNQSSSHSTPYTHSGGKQTY